MEALAGGKVVEEMVEVMVEEMEVEAMGMVKVEDLVGGATVGV